MLQHLCSTFIVLKNSKKTESQEKEDGLLKIIGQQKVEIDFLKQALS
ncbi:MAG: transposase [Crocinitomicaceae bacterium]|jgi:transposase